MSTADLRSFAASASWLERACNTIPGGASSPIRHFREVDTPALFLTDGSGTRVRDIDGNQYHDFILGLGPLVLGHCNPEVVEAIARQAARGLLFASANEVEVELAEILRNADTFVERVRFVCSGTEAMMTAVRLARVFTGRLAILKFEGAYHGHSDHLLGQVRKGPMKSAPIMGKPESTQLHLARYNDLDSVEAILDRFGANIAAIVVEPVASNMGLVPPQPGFLEGLRGLANQSGALLIADEVVSGFRYRFGTVCDQLGVQPDLVAYGKIVGGGLPIGAYGGRADVMQLLLESSGVFQGGTFAASPVSMAAGVAQLKVLSRPGQYEKLDELGSSLCEGLQRGFTQSGLSYSAQRYGSLVSPILVEGGAPLKNLDDVRHQNGLLFARVHLALAHRGFLIPPSVEEPLFLSLAHTESTVSALASAYVDAVCEARLLSEVK